MWIKGQMVAGTTHTMLAAVPMRRDEVNDEADDMMGKGVKHPPSSQLTPICDAFSLSLSLPTSPKAPDKTVRRDADASYVSILYNRHHFYL